MKNTKRPTGLQAKLILGFAVLGMLPLVILALITLNSSRNISDGVAGSYGAIATGINDRIDRNLFERYGDVQAFGVNTAVLDKSSWYQVGSATNGIAAVANRYLNLYGLYLLAIFVDLDGRVIAVNDKDAAGKPIETAALYQQNYKDAVWFKESLAGNFLKSAVLDGTFVEDVRVDELVKTIYKNDGLVVGFSAPVKDASGKVIGVWHNEADFSLVEEIVKSAYQEMKAQGFGSAEMALMNRQGTVILDYDPTVSGKTEVTHDMNILFKLNLAQAGVESARQVVAGKSGGGRALHTRKKVWQTCGYSASQGALGYPGLKWCVLVRVDETQALAASKSIQKQVVSVLALAGIVLVVVAWRLGRSISRPITARLAALNEIGQQVAGAAAQVSGASQSLAEGAGEQAASLEETSASLEEMASMTRRNSEHAAQAKELANQTRVAADAGAGEMATMTAAMDAIKSSSDNIARINKTIDEFAFQTNILALNAAVEAARAGEAGAGFAVVADEVRNLAQRSAMAARETAEKIEDSIRKSQQGVTYSGQVATRFQEIVTKARQVDELLADIVTASAEQNQGIGQINSAVSQLDKVTQSNAAASEESASAATDLDVQSVAMLETVNELLSIVGGSQPSQPVGSHPANSGAQNAKPSLGKANSSRSRQETSVVSDAAVVTGGKWI